MDEVFRRALALHQQGRLAEARVLYAQVLQAQPAHADALNLLGTIALQSGDAAGALALITQALAAQPRMANAYNNRAVALRELGREAEALADCEQALQLEPSNAQALTNRGVSLKNLGRPDEALASYDRAIAIAPGDAIAHNNRGVLLRERREWDAALASFDTAIRLQPAYAEAWRNRGGALHEAGRVEDAVASYTQAVQLQPDAAKGWSDLGVAHHDAGRYDASLAALARASTLDPLLADAWWNQALVHLLHGRFDIGWPLYEWRRRAAGAQRDHRAFAQPMWAGEPLAGRTILLTAEQGFGDTLQFCRYAPLLARQDARVVIEAPAALLPVLRTLGDDDRDAPGRTGAGGITLVARGDALPAFDVHCPLMSLPLALGTRLETIPAPVRYLRADAAKLEAWRERLGPRTRPRVGLAWRGRPTHRMDRERSIPLSMLLAALPAGFEYISLHDEVRDTDRAALAGAPQLRHFGDELRDFADTAALCERVDLVLTVDTSVAHLAGALGRPTWVMLPFVPDFRWLLEREDSPWYPATRLFRQDAARDWAPVLSRVARQLPRDLPRD